MLLLWYGIFLRFDGFRRIYIRKYFKGGCDMEYEKRKVTVDQALYTASDIVHECVVASDIEWYMKNIRDHGSVHA